METDDEIPPKRRPAGAGLPGLLVTLAIAAAATALLPAPAPAATITVTGRFDVPAADSVCMLREAVIAANTDAPALGCPAGSGNDVIALPGGTYKLTRPANGGFDPMTGSLDVYDPEGQELAIRGLGGRVTIDASSIADRLILARSRLVLDSVTLLGGDSAASPDLTGYGGAVATFFSPLAVRHSLIAGSEASIGGGGVYASGPVEVSQSTIAANSVAGADPASGAGGGGLDAAAATTISRSTIAGNSVTTPDATGAGGGVRFGAGGSIEGSILADNTSDGPDPECSTEAGAAAPQSLGFSVIEHASAGCGLTLAGSDREADPLLAPLSDNGGRSPTLAIAPGGPAENIGPAGSDPACAGRLDQRGAPRGSAEAGACDAGAYEVVRCSALPANVVGGPAADNLAEFRPQVSALGLGGDDALGGAGGDDALCGGDGEDVLDGRAGADTLLGGAGTDVADYSAAAAPVAILLDGAANDGGTGEGDQALTESALGGAGGDLMVGDAAGNGLLGGPGDDRIDGGAGSDSVVGQAGNDIVGGAAANDQVRGGDGNDTLSGGDGNDRLDGEDGNDTLAGDAGNDRLFGGPGRNTLSGGDGNDRIYGGPAKDSIACGVGRDLAFAGKKNAVNRDCEKVKRG